MPSCDFRADSICSLVGMTGVLLSVISPSLSPVVEDWLSLRVAM